MRREGEIKQKYKQIKFRLRKDVVKRSVNKIPSNCINNQTHTCGGKKIGLCGLSWVDREWDVIICDDETEEGVKRAIECPNFSPWKSVDQVKNEFDSLVKSASSDIGMLAYYHPDLAALFWVLEDPEEKEEDLEEKEEDPEEKEEDPEEKEEDPEEKEEDPEEKEEDPEEKEEDSNGYKPKVEFTLFTDQEMWTMRMVNNAILVFAVASLIIIVLNFLDIF